MSAKAIAADLTRMHPKILDGAGNYRIIGSSFCMPWFPEEPPIIGKASELHRRATELFGFGETRYDPGNPGRRAWAEGWLGMCAQPDQLKRPNVNLRWCPEKNQPIEITFTSLIAQALAPERSCSSFITLVVPDAIGPGGQQDLIDELSSSKCEVCLIPRPVAAALAWCNTSMANQLLSQSRTRRNNYIGELIVSTAHGDYWELCKILIRVDQGKKGLILCPVRDRSKVPSEIPVWGIAWQLAQGIRAGLAPEECWIRILLGKSVISKNLPDHNNLNAAIDFILSLGVNAPAVNFNSFDLIQKKLPAHDSEHTILGIIHSGFCDGNNLPQPLHFITQHFPKVRVLAEEDLALEGALIAAQRSVVGDPIYFESLVPLDLFVQRRNLYDDPIPGWEPLIESLEIEAGKDYNTPKPIRGFTLPAQQTELPLCLRRTIQGQIHLRGAKIRIHNPFLGPEDAEVSATVRPGHGQGRVDVQSTIPNKFTAHLDWNSLEGRKNHPTIKHAWPPGNAKVVSVKELAFRAKEAMVNFLKLYRSGLINDENVDSSLNEVRSKINLWPSLSSFEWKYNYVPNLNVDSDVDRRFLYVGPIPSDDGEVHSCLKEMLVEFVDILSEITISSPSISVINCGSWLYQRCPESLRESVLKDYLSKEKLDRARLFFAGTVFMRPQELQIFFKRFIHEIQNTQITNTRDWNRAYRNIARFRPKGVSPEMLKRSHQEILSKFLLDTINIQMRSKKTGHILIDALRVFPHMLKRRRFERNFHHPKSDEGLRWATMLSSVRESNFVTPHCKKLADASYKFLLQEADDNTIEFLGASE